jgi:uncharacterized SAM-binding protein YcdF (DUF218 family)
MSNSVLEHADVLWTYSSSMRNRAACDAIVVCCSYDLRVCDYACELVRGGLAPQLVLSGRSGNWTRHLWDIPEAQVFKARALENGIEARRILLEEEATNFGENIAFVRRLLPKLERAVFVTKPNAVLRVALTAPVQWPELQAFVDAPPLKFPDGVSQIIGVFGVIHEMVGDIERVLHYPARGFQIAHRLPSSVLESFEALKAQGFDQHRL